MNIKENLKYTKDHEWIKLEDNIATVGITDFAQSELGDIVYVEVETLDETLVKDDVLEQLRQLKQFLICSYLCQEKLLSLMKIFLMHQNPLMIHLTMRDG